MKTKDCCGIPYNPEWVEESPGDWVFRSCCPTCGKVTECQPNGADMQALHRILATRPQAPVQEPVSTDQVAQDDIQAAHGAQVVMRIMSDFKSWHSRADRTPQQIEDKINECITRCQAEVDHVPTRDKAVEGFGMMLGRIQEFTVDPPPDE